jgi:LAGLIDADG DNA endonuclease family
MVDFNNNEFITLSILPFIKPKTRANERVGPHNEDVISVIIGSMLGDSYGEKHGKGTRFTLQQEESNMEYLVWFHKFFNDRGYCSDTKPKVNIRLGKNNKIRYLFRFKTFTFTSFDWIQESFYSNGVKCVPKDIDKYLTPLALAI